MKTTMHVDESVKWNRVLANVQSIMKYGEQNGIEAIVEVVANGEAVKDLREEHARKEGLYDTVRDLALEGVKFAACRNALSGFEIRESSVIPFVEIVPSGTVELIKKQQDGYAYVKP